VVFEKVLGAKPLATGENLAVEEQNGDGQHERRQRKSPGAFYRSLRMRPLESR
jgi:hypothetical protein